MLPIGGNLVGTRETAEAAWVGGWVGGGVGLDRGRKGGLNELPYARGRWVGG